MSKAITATSLGILIEELQNSSNPIKWTSKLSDLLPDTWGLQDESASEKANLIDILSHLDLSFWLVGLVMNRALTMPPRFKRRAGSEKNETDVDPSTDKAPYAGIPITFYVGTYTNAGYPGNLALCAPQST
jgi:hypothetical protein